MDEAISVDVSWRDLLGAATIGLAASAFGTTAANVAPPAAGQAGARRKLGTLEVSSVGLGV